MARLALLGFQPSSAHSSREDLRALARAVPSYQASVPEAGQPLLWKGSRRERLGESLWWETGWALIPVSLGGRKSAVGLVPRRCYFEKCTGGLPLRAREFEILDGRNRPRGDAPDLLLQNGLELLCGLSSGAEPLTLARLAPDLASDVVIRIRGAELPARDRLAAYHEQQGIHSLPEGPWIALIPEEGVAPETATRFAETLLAVFRRRKIDSRIRIAIRTVAQLEERFPSGGGAQPFRKEASSGAVWFLLKTRSAEPSSRMLELFRRLDQAGAPWRRAYADDPLEHSVRDQAASLIQAVGGIPHRVGLREGRVLPWSLGVDLSHNHHADRSRLCVTLVSPDGALEGAWVREQPRDETARTENLRPLLREAAGTLRAAGGAGIVLAIRDGRLFENENPDLYRSELGTRVELLELAKNSNPPLFEEEDGSGPRPPRGAVAGFHPSGQWVYLLPGVTQEVGGLESVLRFRRRPGGDSSAFADRDLAEILVALTYAPGLGSRRSRFPAPIYWADGIAGASDRDLRFRGQLVRWPEGV